MSAHAVPPLRASGDAGSDATDADGPDPSDAARGATPAVGAADAADVLVGRDGWLFLAGGPDAPLALYGPESPFTDATAGAWRTLLDVRAARLAALGIDYAHVAVPDKLTLMHERLDALPADTPFDPDAAPLRRLAALPAGRPAALLELLPYLERQRERFALYGKGDTRWTPWACYMACQLLCARLGVALNEQLLGYPFDERERVPDLGARLVPPVPETLRRYRFSQRSRRRYANELVELRDASGRDHDRRLDGGSRVVFVNGHPAAVPRTVMLFGEACSDVERHLLTGMLAETFAELHFVWSDNVDFAHVARVRPDVVLTQGVERRMATPPTDDVDTARLAERHVAELRARAAPGAPPPRTGPRAVAALVPWRRGADGDRGGPLRRPGPILRPEPLRRPEPVRREVLLDTETYRLDPPITVQPECVDDVNDTVMTTNPVTYTEVHDARVYFTGGRWLVRAADGETVLRWDVDDERARRVQWETHRPLEGTSLLFATSPGAHCYYHWMLELLPRLGLLERRGVDLASIDHFLVREITGGWQLETLARFGIGRERIVETARHPYRHCERVLHVDVACGINLKMHRFIPMWMKHLYPVDAAGEGRLRLYLSRPDGVRRGVANEAALAPLLARAGIERVVMEGRSVAEQARLLARADVVVAPHGGALTNTVFCRPGTRVVELLSRHVYPYYYGLAASCGHVYHAVLENPAEDYPRLVNHRIAQSFGDADVQARTSGRSFDVPPEAFERMLERL